MLYRMKTPILLLVPFALLSACSPRSTSQQPVTSIAGMTSSGSSAPLFSGSPSKPDTGGSPVITQPVNFAPKLAIANQSWSSPQVLRLVEDLRELSRVNGDDTLGNLAGGIHRAYYAAPVATSSKFLTSPLATAIVGEGEAPLRAGATALQSTIGDASKNFGDLLTDSAKTYPFPKSLAKFSDATRALDGYMAWLDSQVQALNVPGLLKAAALQGLDAQYQKQRPSFVAMASGLDAAHTLATSLTALQSGLKGLGMQLKPADQQKLAQASDLSAQLAQMQDSQGALGVLITVWDITPAAQRKSTFQPISPELYDFLSTKNDDELSCLAHPHCPNPALGIAKLVIFEKIEKYGVQKIHDQVDSAARDNLLATARAQVLAMLPTVPLTIRDSLTKQLAPLTGVLAKLLSDVPGFTQSHLTAWAGKSFNPVLAGLETSSVVFTLQSRDQIAVQPAAAVGSVVSTGAETLGASLALAQAYLPAGDSAEVRALVAAPLAKLLALAGFRETGDKPFPGFVLPLSGSPSQIFRPANVLSDSTTYLVPDSFSANSAYQMDRAHASRNVSAGAQATLLLGIARQLAFYRDWEQAAFDTSLGRVMLQDLAPELPQGFVAASLLPKDRLFALALANAGALLANFTHADGPAFTLAGGNASFGDHFDGAAPSGVVSYSGGSRASAVSTGDVARTILALDEFLTATDGMESTQSALVKAKLPAYLELRRKMQLLESGLANYLVSVAPVSDGTLASSVAVGAVSAGASGARRLDDQSWAIRALLVASRRTGQDSFQAAALKVFAGMNKSMFDASKGFYAAEVGADNKITRDASLSEIVGMLAAGEELSAVMSADVRTQWTGIAKPWIKALQDL
jgi:hypothetical protein